jgi:hypothetical protein
MCAGEIICGEPLGVESNHLKVEYTNFLRRSRNKRRDALKEKRKEKKRILRKPRENK